MVVLMPSPVYCKCGRVLLYGVPAENQLPPTPGGWNGMSHGSDDCVPEEPATGIVIGCDFYPDEATRKRLDESTRKQLGIA